MTVNRIRRNTGRPWRRARDEVYRTEYLCARCGLAVDKSLPPNHDYGKSVGHIVPPNMGGTDDRSNLRLEHRICNAMGRHAGPVPASIRDYDETVDEAGRTVETPPVRSQIW